MKNNRLSHAWIVLVWAAAAVALGATGILATLPPQIAPLLIWTPILLTIWRARRSESFRQWLAGVDLSPFIWAHLGRVAFGVLFLAESGGRVPELFAQVAGPGDIAAGLLALPAGFLARHPDRHSRWLWLWNVLGLLDILAAFVTAQRLLFLTPDPRMKVLLAQLPYAALPLFVVPFIILSHILIFWRLRRLQAPLAVISG